VGWGTRSPRTRPTRGFFRRLDVRLVLALSSVAIAALLVSGLALFQILPGYFIEQAQTRLNEALGPTEDAIATELGTVEQQGQLLVAEVRQDYLQRAAQSAADSAALATVVITDLSDGSMVRAKPSESDQARLTREGLSPDARVRSQSEVYAYTSDSSPRVTLQFRVELSDPFTQRTSTMAQIRETLIAAGAMALFASLLVGILLSRRLAAPIDRLRRVSSRLAAGDLDQRARHSGIVEIDQLARQFNVMADRLSESLRVAEADRDRLREFVADVSHELRTPIAALRTFTELQRDGELDAETRREFLDRSNEQLARLEWLSTNLLDLSRIEAGIFPLDVGPGDLRDPVRFVVEAHAEVADQRGVSLGSAVPSEPVELRFDRERIVQLVNNLVGNALKFTPRGGQVQVAVEDAPEEAVVEVRDTGPGIPASELPRIFDRFYRGTNVGEARASGSGLGLAIARSIAEMHGGSIEVSSEVNVGSLFRVRLPRLHGPAADPPATQVARAQRARRGRSSASPAADPRAGTQRAGQH
jgi:signal transduction histidine kinase